MPNILLVDDAKINRSIMQNILNILFKDFNYLHASNGIEAMKYINENDIDLVILDLIMPEKDGFEVLKEIKEDPEKNQIPVIVNSSLDDMGSIQRALKLGAYDYFVKPIKEQDIEMVLLIKVRNALLSYERFKEISKMNKHMELEMKFANLFQKTLLTEYRDTEIASMYAKYHSAGDFLGHLYDCAQVEDTFWFIAADVSGHGTVAAMLTSMIKGAIRSYVKATTSPSDVLKHINNIFHTILQDGLHLEFSAFVGLIKDNKFYYANAGYSSPILVDGSNSEVKILKKSGLMLGVFEDVDYDISSIDVSKDTVIALYSSGNITDESMDSDDEQQLYKYYSENKDELNELKKSDKELLIDKVLNELEEDNITQKECVAVMVHVK